MASSSSLLGTLMAVVLLLLSAQNWFAAAVYHPPNRPRKPAAQELKVVFSSVHHLMFCRDCDDPAEDGALMIPHKVHFNPNSFFVSSVLVFAIPNDASYELYNAHELAGKIAVFTRGKVSVVHKVLLAQSAGAVAALVFDSDKCDPNTMHCHRAVPSSPLSYPSSKDTLGMFHDDPISPWLNVKIPVAMLSAADGARIRSFMDLVTVEVNGEMNFLVGV